MKIKRAAAIILACTMLMGQVAYADEYVGNDVYGTDIIFNEQTLPQMTDESEENTAALFAGGEGTVENPYQISNAEQLNNVRKDMTANYVLVNDIDLSQYGNWEAIGTYENPFLGTFDGAEHSIIGLTIYDTCVYDQLNGYAGLFGICCYSDKPGSSTIKNLKIKDLSVYIKDDEKRILVGGVVAQSKGEVINCSVEGSIHISDCYDITLGGIIAYGNGSKVQLCTSNVEIYAESTKTDDRGYHGTIVCGGISASGGNIEDCFNYGEIAAVSGNFLYCGGICGTSGTVNHCANYGNIDGKTIYDELGLGGDKGNCIIGGIAGSNSRIENAVNYGDLEGKSLDNYHQIKEDETIANLCAVGGIGGGMGWADACGTIKNCFNLGNIINVNVNSPNYSLVCGGRISSIRPLEGIEGCYSIETTKINGFIPTSDIGTNYRNGASLDYNSICQLVYDTLGFENPDSLETIVGTLQSVDLNDFTVKIDDKSYSVSDNFEINTAADIINHHECKTVIVMLVNGEIDKMDDITEAVYPQIKLSTDVKSLTYLNGKIDTNKFDGRVDISCVVKEPYDLTGLEDMVDKELVSVSLDKVRLETFGYGLYFEKGGWFSSNKTTVDIPANVTLSVGESKVYPFEVYVEDDYKPENVTQSLSMQCSISDKGKEYADIMNISVGNVDLQEEQQETKKAGRESSKDLLTAVNTLDGLQIALDKTLLAEYFTSAQIKNIDKCIYTWVSDIIATTDLIHDDENGVIHTIRKKTGLTNDDIMSAVLGKMGVNENVLTKIDNTKAVTQIVATGKKGEKITIYCSLNLGFNAFKGSAPYSGFGTLKYYILDNGHKRESMAKSVIAYTDINAFTNQLQKIAENNIKSAYGEVWGKDANKVAEMLAGETISKVLNKSVGTFSDNVFTILESPTTNYIRKISVHCPVDVYVYDAEGIICGIIENNVVDPSYDSIYMYVDGDEKYFFLTKDDYTVHFAGNDEGEMTYIVEEYIDDNLIRRIEYNEIPLNTEKEYYSILPDAIYLDQVIYNPVADTGDILNANKDNWQDDLPEQVFVSGVKINQEEITLEIDSEEQLLSNVLPIDATIQLVEWTSQDETIATVTNEGVVKAIGEGETTIQVSTVDGGFLAECKVIVKSIRVKGDVNEDQTVDIQDLRTILRYVCGKIELTERQLKIADIDGNGEVDIQDLRKVLRFVCGKIESLE